MKTNIILILAVIAVIQLIVRNPHNSETTCVPKDHEPIGSAFTGNIPANQPQRLYR